MSLKLKNFQNSYLSILNNELSGLNLTRITDVNEFWTKQIVDSILPFTEFCELKDCLLDSSKVYDLGFGGGFPILPLAVEYEEQNFIGVEKRLKKVKAVTLISEKININNTRFIHEQYQNIHFKKDELVISKAMASADVVLNNMSADVGAKVGFYKGPKFEEEELEKVKKINNLWKIFFQKNYKLEDGSKRTFVLFEKCST